VPTTSYGISKRAGEAAVQAANPKHIILRTAWIYSALGRNFVTSILERARSGTALRVVADRFGNPTYAPHLVDAILAIASEVTKVDPTGSMPWGIYHAAARGRASWHEIARQALLNTDDVKHLAASVEAITSADYPSQTPRPAHSELDCTKLEKNFGIRLPVWTEGLAQCVARLSNKASV
jgi:dTDP-4-dehydrorhamnose reductase